MHLLQGLQSLKFDAHTHLLYVRFCVRLFVRVTGGNGLWLAVVVWGWRPLHTCFAKAMLAPHTLLIHSLHTCGSVMHTQRWRLGQPCQRGYDRLRALQRRERTAVGYRWHGYVSERIRSLTMQLIRIFNRIKGTVEDCWQSNAALSKVDCPCEWESLHDQLAYCQHVYVFCMFTGRFPVGRYHKSDLEQSDPCAEATCTLWKSPRACVSLSVPHDVWHQVLCRFLGVVLEWGLVRTVGFTIVHFRYRLSCSQLYGKDVTSYTMCECDHWPILYVLQCEPNLTKSGMFVVMGAVGGLLGAFWNYCQMQLTKCVVLIGWPIVHIRYK